MTKEAAVSFRTTLLQGGKTATGIKIPPEMVEALGQGKRPAVKVTINGGHTYRSTVAVMSGSFMVGVSAENREKAGVAGGDEIDVRLELDTAPRSVEVPKDLKEALDKDSEAKRFFDGLSYSNRLRHVLSINDAKTPETRQRRIEKSVALFKEGKV